MSTDTLCQVGSALAKSRRLAAQDSLEILWHAGEPLVAGLPFYRRASAILDESIGARCRFVQTFQTNATLITPEWCEYWIRSRAQIGVSLDGPREVHDRQRPYRNGHGSFDQVMAGVRLLREFHISLNGLCVLTPLSLGQPERLFDFFVAERIFNVAFNVEEIEGDHTASTLNIRTNESDVCAVYAAFMRRFLDRNERHGSPLTVREFHIQSQRLVNRANDRFFYPVEAETRLGAVVTISRDGDLSSWSPELASGTPGNVHRFSLGNIHSVTNIDELLDGPKALRIQSEINGGIEECRRKCGYFGVCGGGLPSNKFYENGSFQSTETLRCKLQVQALTDVLLARARAAVPASMSSGGQSAAL